MKKSDTKLLDVYEVTFQHIYETAGFDLQGNGLKGKVAFKKNSGKHSCLKYGHWCWKNAIENPMMAIRYLFKI